MNFSTLKGLTIPEGAVTQITDASGNVLWKQAPSGATVTIESEDNSAGAKVVIDGIDYANNSTELTVPLGTVIVVTATVLIVNGTSVSGPYNYTVVGDVNIRVSTNHVNQYVRLPQVVIAER